MKKTIYLLSISTLFIFFSCTNASKKTEIKINEQELLDNLKHLSGDDYEGRGFSKPGNYRAQNFIAKQFEKIQLEKVIPQGYIQKFPYTFKGKRRHRIFPVANPGKDFKNVKDTTVFGGNVLGKIRGEIDKTIVITGHLDHLGIRNGKVYNGADDDASGTVALFAIAAYFKKNPPKHSLVFAAVDAEEIGSLGCSYLLNTYTNSNDIVLNINMDMIAHSDSEIYASGTYHYPELKKPLENINSPIVLKFGHDNPNDKELDDWTFSSDHRIFHNKKIPFIYFGVEDHKDYHKDTDTFENINQQFYVNAVKLIIEAVKNYDNALQ